MPEKENTPGFRITECWLFVAIDADGDEGLPALSTPMGPLPMVCCDERRVADLRPLAEKLARERKVRVELIHFGGTRELVEVFEP